ncbi:hypothetical protein [Limnoraphis robusta]|uniref:Uncharacterized protein n=1 Tax=Limnoraphis robusta CCNP1315 TaxID=3110306 RepID=A0ABU5TV26_9CYAN|nr:hypothetical protein [Limnoraphis robusta]MEA5518744.1 hypothetical protein [Limnoraphis robusta CCNP1315]MEA5544257.1 hypothetical protein [Limnoraphis robusta CCNP1324]
MIPAFRLFGFFSIGVAISATFSHAASLSTDFLPVGLMFVCIVAIFSLAIGLGAYFLRERLGVELYLVYLFISACIAALILGGVLLWY